MGSERVIVFVNASAGKPGIDGGTRFLLEVMKFWRKRDMPVTAVGTRVTFDYLRERGWSGLADVTLVETPSYGLERAEVSPWAIAAGFVARAAVTRRRIESYARGLLAADAGLKLKVFFEDHWPETFPAYGLKRLFPDRVELFFARHLMVYSLTKGFRESQSAGWSWPTPQLVYHWLTQGYASRLARRWETTFSVANPMDRDFLVRKGFDPERVIVTPYAPEKELIRGVPPPPKNDHATYLGRYHPQKGLEDLVDVARLFRDRMGRPLTIDLMGNLDPLRSRIPADLAEGFVFHGSVYNEEKYRKLKASHCFVFPSYHESFGLVILEAMSCGIPVVAYDLPVYRATFRRGIVTAPIGDRQRLAEELVRLYREPEHHARLSREALAEADRFDWDSTMEKLFGPASSAAGADNP